MYDEYLKVFIALSKVRELDDMKGDVVCRAMIVFASLIASSNGVDPATLQAAVALTYLDSGLKVFLGKCSPELVREFISAKSDKSTFN